MRIIYIAILGFVLATGCKTNEKEERIEQPEQKQENNKVNINVPNQDAITINDGPFLDKYSNGIVKMKGEIVKGKKDGIWTAYFPSGVKQSESKYTNGVLDGKSAIFYENGNLRMAGYYDDGKRDGVWRLYKEDGSFDKQINYKDGKKL